MATALPQLAPPTRKLYALNELLPRQCAVVMAVEADAGEMDLLKAMGVCIGRKIEMVKVGDPLILRVLGSRLGLSERLATRVKVDPCMEEGCKPA
ncbi:MAG: hypothetical protein GC164_12020 [Phycisphaera sp.]|nr:hypothetical protein [Phycisphaera sp.]